MRKALLIFIILNSAFEITGAQSWLWGKQPVASGRPYLEAGDEGWGIATDASGNVYETGSFDRGILIYGADTLEAADPNENMFLVKYDANGTIQWAKEGKTIGKYSILFSTSVAVDPWGYIYMAGYYTDTVAIGNDTLVASVPGSSEIYLAKYDPDGNVLWAKQSAINYPKDGVYTIDNTSTGVATDNYGHVYITGNFHNTTSFNGVPVTDPGSLYGNIFIVKYDTSGKVLWAQQGQLASTTCYASGQAVATDAAGNAFVTGYFHDTISFGGNMLVNTSNRTDIFVVKYDPTGAVLWAQQTTSTDDPSWSGAPIASGNALATDPSGNVYVAGNFADQVNFGGYSLLNPIPYQYSFAYGDMFLVKYSPGGSVLWARQGEPTTNSTYSGWGVATDNYGHVYFSGGGWNLPTLNKVKFSIKFGNTTFTLADSSSLECSLLVELDTLGNVLCGTIIQTGGDDVTPLTSDPTGQFVYLGGDYWRQYNNVITGPDTLDGPGTNDSSAEVAFIARWQPCNPPLPLQVSIAKTNDSCTAACNSKATALASRGTSPYTYLWDTQPEDTAQTITGLCPGMYTVTVTDSKGGTATATANILAVATGAGALSAAKNPLCAGDTANLVIKGSAGSIRWQWSATGAGYADIPGAHDSIYAAALQQTTLFRVIAGNGACADTSSTTTVVVLPLPKPAVSTNDSLLCSGDSTQVCTSQNFIAYRWNTGDTTYCTIANAAGGYWVTVTGANHCSAVSPHQQINIYPVPSVSIIRQGDTLSSFGQVNYQWIRNGLPIDSATGPVYVAHQWGLYAVQVTDSNGCTTTSEAISVTTGLQHLTEESVSIFPNPSIDSWQLTVDISLVGSSLEVFDDEGRIVFQSKISLLKSKIELEVASGVYWLRISNGKGGIIKKLIKL